MTEFKKCEDCKNKKYKHWHVYEKYRDGDFNIYGSTEACEHDVKNFKNMKEWRYTTEISNNYYCTITPDMVHFYRNNQVCKHCRDSESDDIFEMFIEQTET